jgi:PqqD family protein of HPr-rel-A system
MQCDPLWYPVAPDAIATRHWDDQLVLYTHVTGSTHHLSSLGCDVMLALLRHPAGIRMADLLRDLAGSAENDSTSDLSTDVEHTLAELAALKLAACNTA